MRSRVFNLRESPRQISTTLEEVTNFVFFAQDFICKAVPHKWIAYALRSYWDHECKYVCRVQLCSGYVLCEVGFEGFEMSSVQIMQAEVATDACKEQRNLIESKIFYSFKNP